jgi:integrase
MSKATTKHRQIKPSKPYPDFPLFAHATGRWAKKIRGKLAYFGPWRDPMGALERFKDQQDDLYAWRIPRAHRDGLTVRDIVNQFLAAKEAQVDVGEITRRTWIDYHRVCLRIVEVFGRTRLVEDLDASDFGRLKASLAQTRGVVALANEVNRCRVVFNFAYAEALIDKPIRYGSTFKRPPKRVLRRAKLAAGPRMFEADELRKILDAAPLQLRGMALLGINAAFGNHDCGTLPERALDVDSGWVTYPRPKTAVERRALLWTETIDTLSEVLADRPTAKDAAAGLVFVTRCGESWAKDFHRNPVSAEFRKLLKKLGLYHRGRGFYALRHTFETIGGDSRDQVAVDRIMGHARDDMASHYRERISDDRLQAVVDHVHDWLFGD